MCEAKLRLSAPPEEEQKLLNSEGERARERARCVPFWQPRFRLVASACVCVRSQPSNSRHFDLFATSWFVAGFFPCEPFRPDCGPRTHPSRSGPVPFDAWWRREPFEPGTDPCSGSEIRRKRARKKIHFEKLENFALLEHGRRRFFVRESAARRAVCVCVRVSNFVRKIATSRKNRKIGQNKNNFPQTFGKIL